MTDSDGLLDPDSVGELPFGVYKLAGLVTRTTCLGFGDESRLDPKHAILRLPSRCSGKRELGATLLGPTCAIARVCSKCLCNLHNAVCNRHGVRQPLCRRLDDVVSLVVAVAPAVEGVWHALSCDWDDDAWLSKWPYVKQLLIRASVLADVILPSRCKAMVKREVYHKIITKARAIQYYPNLATQAIYAPWFFSLQKAWCQVNYRFEWCEGVRVTFASGMNATQMGEWMRDCLHDADDYRFYERDGESWDACISEEHHRIRMEAYRFMPRVFLDFVQSSWEVVITATGEGGRFKYRLRGTVKSGHNDTTLGNTIINAAITVAVFRLLGLRGDIIVAGDDLLCIIHGDFDAAAMMSAERSMGLLPKAAKITSLDHVSFISGVWWQNGDTYAFTPKPGRLMARLWWTVNPPSRKQHDAYCRGVAWGLYPTCWALPVVRALIGPWLVEGERWLPSSKNLDAWSQYVNWDVGALEAQFLARYELDSASLLNAESLVRTRDPLYIVSAVLERIVEFDDSGPEWRASVAGGRVPVP